MANPFDLEQDRLIHTVSGVTASDLIQCDMLNAESIGENKFLLFIKENVLSKSPDLFKKITKTNLKTFTFALKRIITSTLKGKEVTLKSLRDPCACLLLLAILLASTKLFS